MKRGKKKKMVRLKRNPFKTATDAQAFAIGAIIILTIALTTAGSYLSINAPIETKNCEFQHSSEVTTDFTALDASVQYLLHAESTVASTSLPIKLTPTKVSLIALPLSSGSIRFSPTEGNITVRVDENGAPVSGPWTDNDFSNTTTSNIDTASGNATLAGPPYSLGYVISTMNTVEGHIGKDTGSNRTVYENLSWYASIRPNTKLAIKVRTDMFSNLTQAKEWYECTEIESEDGFNEISLADLSSVSNGHRYVQYRAELKTWDPSETPTLRNITVNFSSSAGGVALTNSSGSIIFASNYHYLPNQVLAYENGAVMKSQLAGEFLVSPSNISISNASGVPRINVSLIDLTESNVPTYTGAPTISVRLLRGDYDLISESFFYPNLTLNISTAYPSICSNWFNKTLEESGLNSSDYNVAVDTPAKNVEITFYGHGEGVELYLEKTAVAVYIQR